MLVFGDHKYSAPAAAFKAKLLDRAERTKVNDLDGLRTLLIQAGQLEQAVADHRDESFHQSSSSRRKEAHCESADKDSASSRQLLPGSEVENRKNSISGQSLGEPLAHVMEATDYAATAFYRLWSQRGGVDVSTGLRVEEALKHFEASLRKLWFSTSPLLEFKIPEGFAFYGLFPEQYCVSAHKWIAIHSNTVAKHVLVVGIRSIGTSLSALCLSALRAGGWEATRLTVRPRGPPFDRMLDEPCPLDAKASFAIIVDEGPGLSGSSMKAVADWLSKAGLREIAFFPGHNGEPGSAGSEEVRRVWRNTPRFFTSLEELTTITLVGEQCLNIVDRSLSVDVSGGEWRRIAFADESQWPAATPKFERRKFLHRLPNGRKTLSKFIGLGCALETFQTPGERALSRTQELVEQGWIEERPQYSHGFIARHWLEGRRLMSEDRSRAEVLNLLARYLAGTRGPAQPAASRKESIARLAEMLYWNTREAYAEDLAETTRALERAALDCELEASFGDGRMQPWEWVETSSGKIVKTIPLGRDCDHTLVGKQSLLWDVAGALIEWNLEAGQAEFMISALERKGIRFSGKSLKFYCAAYTAFRMGLMMVCASQEAEDSNEKTRLCVAAEYYRAKLGSIIAMDQRRARSITNCLPSSV